LVDIRFLENQPLRTSDAEFFTCLVSEIKKNGIWAQKKLLFIEKEKIRKLELRLEDLKKNFERNFESIFDTEKKLQKIRSDDLNNKLRDLRIFECLNAEKASPHFLNIAKKSNQEASINDIKNEDGLPFVDDESRNEHISDFYGKLYKKDLSVQGNIESFLGPRICNLPHIKASKLTDEERDRLDEPLAIAELDKALEQVNIKSAPGIDGYSYRFIKKFWDIFRLPLFKCAIDSLENENPPEFFLTAQI
jgi:hypothetical protein